jgi:hypothetical protein
MVVTFEERIWGSIDVVVSVSLGGVSQLISGVTQVVCNRDREVKAKGLV